MGMSNSIRRGLQVASGDLLMKQDADLEYDPNDIKLLLAPILEGKAEAAIGSRFFMRIFFQKDRETPGRCPTVL